MALSTAALVSLAEAKDWLEIIGAAEDAEIERLIDSSSLFVEGFTGRKLKSRSYSQELYDGTGNRELRLREYPVTAVSAVDFLQSVGTSGVTWEAQTLTNLVIAEANGSFSRGLLYWRDEAFPKGRFNVRVSYTAGETTIPEDLKRACLEIIALKRRTQDKATAGVLSRTFNGQTVTFFDKAMMDETFALLHPYRRMV